MKRRAHRCLTIRVLTANNPYGTGDIAGLGRLSAPFWHRMGYRPLWSSWEARPASTLR